MVFDPDQVEVSSKILAGFKEAKSKRKVKLYIVRFYDRGSTWYAPFFVNFVTSISDHSSFYRSGYRQYLPREKLMLLGEDMSELSFIVWCIVTCLTVSITGVDSDMIAAHSVKQRWKSAKLRTGCREAYR